MATPADYEPASRNEQSPSRAGTAFHFKPPGHHESDSIGDAAGGIGASVCRSAGGDTTSCDAAGGDSTGVCASAAACFGQ